MAENYLTEAKNIASKFHNTVSLKQRQEETCQSSLCLLFPVDIYEGIDAKTTCNECKGSVHLLCEGVSELTLGSEDHIEYICNKCRQFSVEEISNKFEDTIKELKCSEESIYKDKVSLDLMRQDVYHKMEKGYGTRLKTLNSSMKELGTKEASYHGGDCNGVDSEKMLKHVLECDSWRDNKLLICIVDIPAKAEAYHQMFVILANCWQILRHPPRAGPGTKYDDEELDEAITWCEAWAKQLPVLFPDRNLTRKGHALSCHIPETLKEYRSYYMFYKAEQTGEKVHSLFNKLMKRWASVRPKERRLWGMISDYEAKNCFVTDINIKRPRKNKD